MDPRKLRTQQMQLAQGRKRKMEAVVASTVFVGLRTLRGQHA